jgi:hypothetical protein
MQPFEGGKDLTRGLNMGRRRIVSLAMYTTVGVLLASGNRAAHADEGQSEGADIVREDDSYILTCAPAETAPTYDDGYLVEVIDPKDLKRLNRQYADR